MLALITFPSTHDAMRAEKMLLQAGFQVTLLPVPREISGDCGLALRLEADHLAASRAVLLAGLVYVGGVFTGGPGAWREVEVDNWAGGVV